MRISLGHAISTGVLDRVIVDRPARDMSRPGLRNLEHVTYDPLQRWVAGRGALLLAIGMVTGLWSGAALSGMVKVPIPHLALAAHLNCLMGCFWLLGFAYTLPMLSYGEQGKARLAKLMVVPTYANWGVTLIASFLGVRGISFVGELKNDLIAVLLDGLVVLPALVASVAWANGFRKRSA